MDDPHQKPAAERELALRQGRVLEMTRIPSGSNAVFKVTLESPAGTVGAIYKPARGERPLWDFPPGTLHRREVATYLVDRALRWQLVPQTVLRPEAPLGPGSMQEWIAGPASPPELDRSRVEAELRRLAALDVLVNNADRKAAHLLVGDDLGLRAIDHGVTFNEEFKLRTVLSELGGEPVPEPVLTDLGSLLAERERITTLRSELGSLLSRSEVRAFFSRARELLGSRRYPLLHPYWGRPSEW